MHLTSVLATAATVALALLGSADAKHHNDKKAIKDVHYPSYSKVKTYEGQPILAGNPSRVNKPFRMPSALVDQTQAEEDQSINIVADDSEVITITVSKSKASDKKQHHQKKPKVDSDSDSDDEVKARISIVFLCFVGGQGCRHHGTAWL
jgi:antitoxin component of MazEF toxin-antitoxin module